MTSPAKKITIPQITAMKNTHPIVCLTAYTAPMARLLDEHADLLLVGDSLGMVIYGMPNTLQVTMEMMLRHAKAVTDATQKACVVVDMPFRSFESSPAQAFDNAARLIAESGAQAVKIEGGAEMQNTIAYLCDRGISVMGHVGLLPQRVNAYGGFRRQGREQAQKDRIKADALAVQDAGAFAVVIESVTVDLADDVTQALSIPTIGIGASPNCDGQILVCDDLLGLDRGYVPSFVKQYADLNSIIKNAARKFAADVRQKQFPEDRHCFNNIGKVIALKQNR